MAPMAATPKAKPMLSTLWPVVTANVPMKTSMKVPRSSVIKRFPSEGLVADMRRMYRWLFDIKFSYSGGG